MANANKPFGARWLRSISGSEPIINAYSVDVGDGNALFVGDFVVGDGTNGSDAQGRPAVKKAGLNANLTGVIMGFQVVPTNLETVHRLASTERIVYVCDDPYAVYAIQEDGATTGAALLIDEVGQNTEIVVGAGGSTVSGLSGMLMESDPTGTGTAQLRILRIAQFPGNEIGAYCVYEVMINEHEHKSTTGT